MKNEANIKEKIYWIGEHSYEIYKQTNKLILENFDNQVLIYSRIDSNTPISNDIIYLDEFFPMNERNYLVADLQKPISHFMKDRKIPFEKGLIIGDASEIIVQALVAVGSFEFGELYSREEIVADFEEVHKIETDTEKIKEFNMVDVSGFSILFLNEAMPFKDSLETAKEYKVRADKTFHHVLKQKNQEFNMNEFLFHLENGLNEAVSKSSGVELN